jgi:hypothetical protein
VRPTDRASLGRQLTVVKRRPPSAATFARSTCRHDHCQRQRICSQVGKRRPCRQHFRRPAITSLYAGHRRPAAPRTPRGRQSSAGRSSTGRRQRPMARLGVPVPCGEAGRPLPPRLWRGRLVLSARRRTRRHRRRHARRLSSRSSRCSSRPLQLAVAAAAATTPACALRLPFSSSSSRRPQPLCTDHGAIYCRSRRPSSCHHSPPRCRSSSSSRRRVPLLRLSHHSLVCSSSRPSLA